MCFTLSWVQSLIVNVIILAVVIAVIRILVPWVFGMVGLAPGPLMQIINIILWGIVAIFCVYIVFGLLSCLGGGFSLLPHR